MSTRKMATDIPTKKDIMPFMESTIWSPTARIVAGVTSLAT